jgi:adenylosuccinate synthase
MIGAQWGDEGKGRITDLMANKAAMIIRFSGGNNAGHTVIVGNEKFELHLIPCGILHEDKDNILGNGMVIHPPALVEEMQGLEQRGVSVERLKISDAAHVVMPYHLALDKLEEEFKAGSKDGKVGTTLRGIGPTYVDKAARRGIRMGDLLDEDRLRSKLETNLLYTNKILQNVFEAEPFNADDIIEQYRPSIERLRPHITNTALLIQECMQSGGQLFFEGAQGVLLDVDQGTYPYVTSSNPSAGGVCTGSGVGPTAIQRVIGVTKAYVTRVGTGPFPTEQDNAIGEQLQIKGHEVGVTTGRTRRCGWFDAVLLRHAVRTNGLTDIALTKLDVLSGFDPIVVCDAYRYKDQILTEYPSDTNILEHVEPIYTELPGWTEDISSVRKYKDLPPQARTYIEWIEEHGGVKASVISLGPEREMAIVRD